MFTRRNVSLFLLLCLFTALAACAKSDYGAVFVNQKLSEAQSTYGFTQQNIPTTTFTLYGLLRPAQPQSAQSDTLHVYIEGDGQAWLSRYEPSSDPTPTQDTTLDLAKRDPSSASILYLARPCQYVQNSQCNMKYWTSHRFAPEVITATNEAINTIKAQVGAKKIVLVGYSGGGAVAALAAAQRKNLNDVTFLGSIAGNLDIKTWVDWHKISPLKGSLNPVEVATQLTHIPQRHVTSNNDSIIPPQTNINFCKALQNPQYCTTVNDIEHDGPWERIWSYNY